MFIYFYFVNVYRCRAPIASLDCMEEFNGGSGGMDSGVHCSTTHQGTKEQLLTSCIGSQSQRSQHPSPGIRYRNLGKSGLRVSNVGLGMHNQTIYIYFLFIFPLILIFFFLDFFSFNIFYHFFYCSFFFSTLFHLLIINTK